MDGRSKEACREGRLPATYPHPLTSKDYITPGRVAIGIVLFLAQSVSPGF
jgi:hypothetical protein